MGVSRSRLFSMALEDYLRHRRNQAITEALNRVYAGGQAMEETRLLKGMKETFRRTIKDRW